MENKELITKAIAYIHRNPRENLSLAEIAEKAGFSLNYFDTLCKNHTGYNAVEYSRIYKLTRSALDLRRTDKSILDIALDYGYANPESFTRAFKKFYGMTPSEYRESYKNRPVTWHDLSSKVAINRFKQTFPMLKGVDFGYALDFLFTHNPLRYGEEIIDMDVAETEVFTLDTSDEPEHFLMVSDYNDPEPFITMVCEDENTAVEYLKLLAEHGIGRLKFSLSVGVSWNVFKKEAAALGFGCRTSSEYIVDENKEYAPTAAVKELTENDLPLLSAFCDCGGCHRGHYMSQKIAFEGKGNIGQRAVAWMKNGEIGCLFLICHESVRDLSQNTIGAILPRPDCDVDFENITAAVIEHLRSDGLTIRYGASFDPEAVQNRVLADKLGLTRVSETYLYEKG